MNPFGDFCIQLGMKENHDVLIHASYHALKDNFQLSGEEIISSLKNLIDEKSGSLIFPAFTYCFKKSDKSSEIFDKVNSESKVGYLSEIFRKSQNVIRTSSPTHSFSIWGNIIDFIGKDNSPESPLGIGSVCDFLDNHENSYVLMLNTNFSSFTMGHFYEIKYKVPWFDFSPWRHLNVENYGVSKTSIQKLKEIPGCAKSFINFEKFLLEENIINKKFFNNFWAYYIRLQNIKSEVEYFYKNNFMHLLCEKSKCNACDSRREFLAEKGVI